MRVGLPSLVALLALSLAFVPSATAAWGEYGADGWPVNVDGASTNPVPGTVLAAPWVTGVAPGAGPLNEVAGTTLYPYYPILTAEVQRLASDHPDLVRLHSAGKSTLGLDLWMLEIADHARIDAGEGIPLDQRETVWVDGGTHSNEYSGVYFVAHLASFLTDEYETNETAQWIVENRHTWIMPMVNPDGSNLFGRLNANAVNVNRNYPVDWGETDESFPMNNPGPHPESEVETRINIEWFNKTMPDYYASVHCCGNLWLYPYGVEGWDPADEDMLSQVCELAFPDVLDDCGPIWSTIYPASGSSVDTAYEYTGAVAFGYEMSGRGAAALWGQPLTTDDVREQEYESWEGVMHAFLNVHKYGAYPEVVGAGQDGIGRVTLEVENTGLGNLTNGTVTTTFADGTVHTVDLPFLASGESAHVRVADAVPEGIHDVRIDYQKRIEAAPMGTQMLRLGVEDTADGRTIEVLPADADALRGKGTLTVEENVPFPAVGLSVLALLALLGVMARRRA